MTIRPEELLEQFKASATARKVKNLDIIDAVCRSQIECKSKDFSIALIGRLSQKRGGPTTQSIRNRGGAPFRALISAWAQHTGGSVRREPKLNENPDSEILDKFEDLELREFVGSLLAERRTLRGHVNRLKRNSTWIIDRRPIPAGSLPDTPLVKPLVHVLPALCSFTSDEKEALRHAISEKLLKNERWRVGDDGSIMDQNGRTQIFRSGFVTAIEKVIAGFEAAT